MADTDDSKLPKYISINTFAEVVDCSPKTIRRLIDSGDIRARRVGARTTRIPATEIDRVFAPSNEENNTNG